MAPAAKPPAEPVELSEDDKARILAFLDAQDPPKKDPKADPPTPTRDTTAGVSLREVESIAREQTLAILDQLRTEEETATRDHRIAELEAALEASKKTEAQPSVVKKLFRLLWGDPPETEADPKVGQ